MGNAALSQSEGSPRSLKDSILLKSIRSVDFTLAPKELRTGQDGEPQWALMSALLDRHTRQLELRKEYLALEKQLDEKYDEENQKDQEFLDALMDVDAKASKGPKTTEETTKAIMDSAEEEAELAKQKLELEKEKQREKMKRRLQARHKSMKLRSMRTVTLVRHTKHKGSMWAAVRNVSMSLQRAFYPTNAHQAAHQSKLEGVELQKFELRSKREALATARKVAAAKENMELRTLNTDLAVAESQMQAAKGDQAQARLKVEDSAGHKHAQWVAEKKIAETKAQIDELSILIADLKFKIQANKDNTKSKQQEFEAEDREINAEIVSLIGQQASKVEAKLDEAQQWVELANDEGIVYYWNSITNVSQWEKPSELLLKDEVHRNRAWKQVVHAHVAMKALGPIQEEDSVHHTLPRFMELVDDISDEKYYYDNLTGETSWDNPAVNPDANVEDPSAKAEFAERVRAVQAQVDSDDRWYYELTRDLLTNGDAKNAIEHQLVRAEWLNLEETTIYQLETDIADVKAELKRLEGGDTAGLLQMLDELYAQEEIPEEKSMTEELEDEIASMATDDLVAQVNRTVSAVQREVVDDFLDQEERAAQQIEAKAAIEKQELQERVKQRRQQAQQR